MGKNIEFRTLRADEIEVRVGDKKNGKMSLLLYQDARCAANILDETVGNQNWSCRPEEAKNTLFYGIAIKTDDGTWVRKFDAGAPSNFEKEKGEASDAFKRAAVKWGIARELYTSPIISIPESNATHSVSKIEYDENRRIKDLEIVDWNGNVVYAFKDGKVQKVQKVQEVSREDVLKAVCSELKETVEDTEKLKKFFYYYQGRCENFDSWNAKLVRNLWQKWISK